VKVPKKKRPGNNACKPVICLETGKEYPSAKAAALSLKVNPAAVSQQIYRGQKCRGFTFKYKK
jgi:hypothetical protein